MQTMPQTVIGTNVLRLREARGWSQAELAQRSGGVVKGPDVSRIETGETKNPGAAKIRALANALGVPVTELWAGDETLVTDGVPLEKFLATRDDITPQEVEALRIAVFPWGPPTLDAWIDTLRIIRSIAASKARGGGS